MRDSSTLDVPFPITPEVLIHGFELNCLNVIPNLQSTPLDKDFCIQNLDSIKTKYDQFKSVRDNLNNMYHREFLKNLMEQAVDDNSRYVPVKGAYVNVGDVVLIEEKFTKTQQYPLGVVVKRYLNVNNEVTNVEVRKGKTGKIIRRHITSLIPFLTLKDQLEIPDETEDKTPTVRSYQGVRPRRRAALESILRTQQMLDD